MTQPYETLLKTATQLIEVYGQAWMRQDPDLILTVFTKDATYHERVLQQAMHGHDAIRQYWETKVCREQAQIEFALRDLHIDPVKSLVVAEWEAWFLDIPGGCKRHMLEIAVLHIKDGQISSLREYWASEKL
jgi:ketosteroid isomerase-like protein